jgi:hypothetical protein
MLNATHYWIEILYVVQTIGSISFPFTKEITEKIGYKHDDNTVFLDFSISSTGLKG